jgi:hypothetical protein
MAIDLPQVALLASPLLGPAVWRSCAHALTDLGWDVLVAPRAGRAPSGPGAVLEHLLGALPLGRPLALVAHSNAGLYLPAASAERPVLATVFVDAALPAASGATQLAPPAMHDFLRGLVGADGLLPSWTEWWPEEELAALFPDPASRSAVAAEQHRLPLSYFKATLDAPADWTDGPAAHLAFDDTYQVERKSAERWGWRVHPHTAGQAPAPACRPEGRRRSRRRTAAAAAGRAVHVAVPRAGGANRTTSRWSATGTWQQTRANARRASGTRSMLLWFVKGWKQDPLAAEWVAVRCRARGRRSA